MYVCGYTHMCPYARVGVLACIYIYLYVLVACYSISDLFGEIWTQLQEIRTRFGSVLVVDPIHRRFEDRSMGWSVDQYQFMQWRPDGDSVSKSHHFKWVFVLMPFSYLLFPVVFMYLFVSFHVIIWHISSAWLPVQFYITSVIVHLMYFVAMSIYWRHSMC